MVISVLKSLGKLYFSAKGPKRPKISMRGIKKIAVIKSGAIGDVLMTTPMLRALRKGMPKTEIVYIVGRQSASVLENNPNVDRIVPFDARVALEKDFRSMLAFSAKIRSENFDAAFVLDKSYLASLFAYVCRIPVRMGFDRYGEGFANTHKITYGNLRHEIDYYLDLLRFLKIKPSGRRMEIFLTAKEKNFAASFFRKNEMRGKRVCIAPSATRDPGLAWSSRAWPSGSYALAVQRLAVGADVIFTGNKNDAKAVSAIKKSAEVKTFSAAGKTSVREAAAVMAACDLVITHDAGPMHMASAVGTPVIAVFGPTDPRRKAPPGCKWLWKGSPCAQCEVFGKFPYCDKHPSTDEIPPEDVVKEAVKILKLRR